MSVSAGEEDAIMSDDSGEKSKETTPVVWGRIQSLTPRLKLRSDLVAPSILLGRSHECQIRFSQDDAWISGRHCRITYNTAEPSFARVEDTSTHGTFVNGSLVGKNASLAIASGETISLRRPPRGAAGHSVDTYVLAFTILTAAERLKQSKCTIEKSSPLRKVYDVLDSIGDGQYSVVFKAVHRESQQQVAIKVMSKELTGTAAAAEKAVVNVKRELEILYRTKHPCIVSMIQSYEDTKRRYIVLEFANGGDLFEHISRKKVLTEDEAARIFVQLLSAVKHLHQTGVIHRDLKPENVLIIEHGDSTLAKVTDFGLATCLSPMELAKTLCGTPQYVAPEILVQSKSKPEEATGYGPRVDLWSLGAILYVMLSGFPAFDGSRKDLFDLILGGRYSFPPEIWGNISLEATELVRGLLTVDPQLRMPLDRALQSPWCYRALLKLRAEGGILGDLAEYELKSITPPPCVLGLPFSLPSAKRAEKFGPGGQAKRMKTDDLAGK